MVHICSIDFDPIRFGCLRYSSVDKFYKHHHLKIIILVDTLSMCCLLDCIFRSKHKLLFVRKCCWWWVEYRPMGNRYMWLGMVSICSIGFNQAESEF